MESVRADPAAPASLLRMMPELDPVQATVARAIYRCIVEFGAATLDQLTESTGLPGELLHGQLADVPGIYWSDAQTIEGFWGLTAKPVSTHRLRLGAQERYAWCAWDTLFLPEILGRSALVESECAVTRQPIRLQVHPDGFEGLQPEAAVVSFHVPPESAFNADVIGAFCHHVLFFADRATGERWGDGRNGFIFLTVGEAFALGREKNRKQFGDSS